MGQKVFFPSFFLSLFEWRHMALLALSVNKVWFIIYALIQLGLLCIKIAQKWKLQKLPLFDIMKLETPIILKWFYFIYSEIRNIKKHTWRNQSILLHQKLYRQVFKFKYMFFYFFVRWGGGGVCFLLTS